MVKVLCVVTIVLLLSCMAYGYIHHSDVNQVTTKFLLDTITQDKGSSGSNVLGHFSGESDAFRSQLSKYLKDGGVYSSEEQFDILYLRLTILAAQQDFYATANFAASEIQKLKINVTSLEFDPIKTHQKFGIGHLDVISSSSSSNSSFSSTTQQELLNHYQNLIQKQSHSHYSYNPPTTHSSPVSSFPSKSISSQIISHATQSLPLSFAPYILSSSSSSSSSSIQSITTTSNHQYFILSVFYHPFRNTPIFVTYTSSQTNQREDIYTFTLDSTTSNTQYFVKVHHIPVFDSLFTSAIIPVRREVEVEVEASEKSKRDLDPTNNHTIKIMSYNIWSSDNFPDRKHMLAGVIQKHSPDIIGIQEIRRSLSDSTSNRLSQIVSILNDSSWSFIYQGAMPYPEQGTEEGLGILTKHKIVPESVRFTRLTHETDGDANTRIVLRSIIDFSWDKIDFFVTHWSYKAGEGQLRNAVETFDYTNSFLTNENYLQVLVADFNIYPYFTKPADYINGKSVINGKKGNFTDVWTTVHDKEDKNGYTFSNLETAEFVDRADRVLMRVPGSLAKDAWRPVASERVGWRVDQESKKPPSDHLAVVAYVQRKV